MIPPPHTHRRACMQLCMHTHTHTHTHSLWTHTGDLQFHGLPFIAVTLFTLPSYCLSFLFSVFFLLHSHVSDDAWWCTCHGLVTMKLLPAGDLPSCLMVYIRSKSPVTPHTWYELIQGRKKSIKVTFSEIPVLGQIYPICICMNWGVTCSPISCVCFPFSAYV